MWAFFGNNRLTKLLFIILGSVSLAVGVVGIFLPLLPTTPFLLLTAACYIKGSPRLYNWLLSHPQLGPYIRNYRERRALPRRTKIIALSLLWLSIGFSVLVLLELLWVRLLLLTIAALVTWHLLSLKTLD